ncbi:50S ribosomal protein L28 [Candidatus Aerophobetes bacterium]|uniref:Large ribosomal subunit protein bL28 n=1 Tax=Aerophobetes bacterium TaxID=2030807 RepID=A0A662DA76_UNCAE|nr:50S ribosomal protein L28 [Candidatus Aerophobetes bacterium]RLE11758.1 MAG: 50S ribosomal protein L28 [Candidatus Aerophobetes bacterium]
MARRCYICGKGPAVGHRVSKSGRRTKRRWLPNLQRKRVKINGSLMRVYVCTSCLKSGKVEVA